MTLIAALVPIVVFGVLLAVVTVPYVSLGPGPTFDTLGEVDGKQVVAIDGAPTHPTSGHLNMTTVAQRDGLTLGQALTLWVSGREQLVPRDLVFPPDKSREDVEKSQNADFKQSEFSAEYAALGFLKYPDAVRVEKVNDPGPSAGKLQVGDAIDAVNGTPVADVEAFTALLKATKPGQEIVIDYRRKNAPPGTARITLGQQLRPRLRLSRCRGARRAVGPVHHRLQSGQHRRPVGGTDVQPRGRGQADHRRPQRVEVRRGHRNHQRGRQGRARSAASPTR